MAKYYIFRLGKIGICIRKNKDGDCEIILKWFYVKVTYVNIFTDLFFFCGATNFIPVRVSNSGSRLCC